LQCEPEDRSCALRSNDYAANGVFTSWPLGRFLYSIRRRTEQHVWWHCGIGRVSSRSRLIFYLEGSGCLDRVVLSFYLQKNLSCGGQNSVEAGISDNVQIILTKYRENNMLVNKTYLYTEPW